MTTLLPRPLLTADLKVVLQALPQPEQPRGPPQAPSCASSSMSTSGANSERNLSSGTPVASERLVSLDAASLTIFSSTNAEITPPHPTPPHVIERFLRIACFGFATHGEVIIDHLQLH